MTIALVNHAEANAAATPASNHTAGNLLFVMVRNDDTQSSATISVSDTAGNTWLTINPRVFIASTGGFQCFYAKNIIGNASNVVTATFSGSPGALGIGVLQYSGLDTVSPLDFHESLAVSGATSPFSSNFFTTLFANEVIIMAITDNVVPTYTAGQVNGTNMVIESLPNGAVEDAIVSTIQTSKQTSISFTAGSEVLYQVATFKAASAAAVSSAVLHQAIATGSSKQRMVSF